MNKVAMKIKMKNWWDAHKAGIITGAITVGSTVLMALIYGKGYSDGKRIGMAGRDIITGDDNERCDGDNFFPNVRSSRAIDEDLYTNIIPQVESAIFTDGLDEAYITATYDVEYPTNGGNSTADGFYTVTKELEINVRDVG